MFSCRGTHTQLYPKYEVWDHLKIIANDPGNRITLLWVSFNRDTSERLVSEAAKNQAALNHEGTVYDVKHLIGRRFDDLQVQRDIKLLTLRGHEQGQKASYKSTI